jgi:hypothetical protein
MRNSDHEIRASSLSDGRRDESFVEFGHRNGNTAQIGEHHDFRHSRDPRILRAHHRHRGGERRDPAYLRLMELRALAWAAVEESVGHLRNPSSRRHRAAAKLSSMKERFPTTRRNGWRQRFLAIARELEAKGVHRRDSLDAVRHPARAGLAGGRALRGIRLGCIRTA